MTNVVRNYDGGITASPAQLVWPRSVAELQSVLSDASRFPSPVRAMGSYHSLTPCVSTDGTIVDMTRMNRIIEIDRQNMTLTAEAGLQFIAASRALRAQKLQFLTNIEIGNMTLGAAACCHTKDGLDGGEFGQVGSYVTAMKWVTPNGELAAASETDDPALLRLMRTSYGLCGIVYEVTFRIKQLEAIHFSYLPRPIEDLTRAGSGAIIDASKGLICWTVGRKAHFQTSKRSTRSARSVPFRRWAAQVMESHRGPGWPLHRSAAFRRDPSGMASHNAWFGGSKLLLSTLRLIGGATLYNPDKTIDYSGTQPSAKYAFTFWAFPRAQWLGALATISSLVNSIPRRMIFAATWRSGRTLSARTRAPSCPTPTMETFSPSTRSTPTRTSRPGIDFSKNSMSLPVNGLAFPC